MRTQNALPCKPIYAPPSRILHAHLNGFGWERRVPDDWCVLGLVVCVCVSVWYPDRKKNVFQMSPTAMLQLDARRRRATGIVGASAETCARVREHQQCRKQFSRSAQCEWDMFTRTYTHVRVFAFKSCIVLRAKRSQSALPRYAT